MFFSFIVLSLALVPATEFAPSPESARPDAPPAVQDTLTANGRRRVERLLDRRVACLGCHTLNGEGGAIGPTLDGVGARLSPDRIRAMIVDPQATLPGSMMPAQPLPPRDLELLTDYLVGAEVWSGSETPTAADTTSVGPLSGPVLYQRHCSSCHGVSGDGDGWNAANLPVAPTAHSDAELMSGRADDTLYDAIHAGGWVLDRSARMPAFGELLAPAQIRLLVDYIRELCACSPPSWSVPGAVQTGVRHDP